MGGGQLWLAIILIALASLILGMGLPVTAAYIVLATLSAPALAGMISDRFVIDQIAAGALTEQAKAIIMFGVPDAAAQLGSAMTRPEAAALVGSLPLEVASPLRDLVVPQEIAIAAVLSAHMIVFWLSQDSNVTPPVALAAFTAAAIAKAPAMRTGIASWKLAKGLYIVPVLIAYTPFLSGDWPAMIWVFATGLIGTYGLSTAIQGCIEHRIGIVPRVVMVIAGISAIWPQMPVLSIGGIMVIFAMIVWSVIQRRKLA